MHRLILCLGALAATLSTSSHIDAQSEGAVAGATGSGPTATLVSAGTIRLTGAVDSNSPAIWERERGQSILHVLTSFAGRPSLATGLNVARLGAAREAGLTPWPAGGNWMEAVIGDVDGAWYGYYHNERIADDVCPGTNKVMPRIGAARSRDHGVTWENLGIILEAPRATQDCTTTNRYFVGGVGDLSVMLDANSNYLYIFFSEYLRQSWLQGVGVARLSWAARDEPVGRVMVWNREVWLPARSVWWSTADDDADRSSVRRWIYPAGTPFYRAVQEWHDDDTVVDAFWGPSVHWNTYLEQYVMLLNRAKDSNFGSEGIYVAFAPRLDAPTLWSTPTKLLSGGSWYPQVIGTELGTGTDKMAGQTARFFMTGRSSSLIRFSK